MNLLLFFGDGNVFHKVRLDVYLANLFPNLSRAQIQSYIIQGKVKIDEQVVTKPGTMVKEGVQVNCDLQEPKFVSRAGFKLERALDHFNIDVMGYTVLDAGISTGGFTDCLLSRGAKKVYGVDVGYGQVHEKVSQDDRVIIYEKTNLRTLEWQNEKVDLVTLDLSFISVLKVMDAVSKILKKNGELIILIKPQFEAQRGEVGRGGIIKDDKVHQSVIQKIIAGLKEYGFGCKGVIESPILGGSGNKEFLGYFIRKL